MKLRSICLALALAAALTACTAPASSSQPAATPETASAETGNTAMESTQSLTFTDDLGRTVEAPRQPRHVAALIGSFADVWRIAGGELAATANDAWTQFDLNLSEDVVNLGTTTELSLEKLFAVKPDFVIASTNTQLDLDWMETLEAAGIPTAYFDVNTFDDYLRMLKICTDLTGRQELYQQNGLDVQQQIDAAIARSDGSTPTVLYLRATAVSVKVKGSADNVLGEMLHDFGCINIADQDGSLLEELSLERIVQADPDYIFVVEQGSDADAIRENLDTLLRDNPAWSGLTAVQEGRLYYMDQKLYNLKPNDRWGEAYEKLADILFPA